MNKNAAILLVVVGIIFAGVGIFALALFTGGGTTGDNGGTDIAGTSPEDTPGKTTGEPGDAPTDTPSDRPAETPGDTPGDTPSDGETAVETPGDTPSDTPEDVPGDGEEAGAWPEDENAIGIRGTVVGDGDEPIAGAIVKAFLFAEFKHESARRTDSLGHFFIEAVLGETYYLRASHEGYTETMMKAAPPAEIMIKLEKGGSISGTVRNDAGTASDAPFDVHVSRMAVDIRQAFTTPGGLADFLQGLALPDDMRQAVTVAGDPATGEYKAEGLPPGNYTVVALAKGYKPAMKDGMVAVAAGEEKTGVDLSLEKAQLLRGIVIDDNTELPIEGAVLTPVVSMGEVSTVEIDFTANSVTTGYDGKFEIYGGNNWRFAMKVSHPDYGETMVTSRGRGESEWTIRLGGMCTIKGKVYDYLRKLMPNARVMYIVERGGLTSGVTVADAEGNYEFANLSPDEYMLVRLADLAKGAFSIRPDEGVEVEAGETVEYDIGLTGATLTGIVTVGGKPLAGALIVADPVEKGREIIAMAGPDGRYVLGDLEGGNYRVVVGTSFMSMEMRGRNEDAGETVYVMADSVTEYDFQLVVGGVSGRVLDSATGKPVEWSAGTSGGDFDNFFSAPAMLIAPGEDEPAAFATVAQDGTFEIGMVKPGTYQLAVSVPGYKIEPITVTVGTEEVKVEVRAVAVTAALVVTVTDEDTGKPVPGADVATRLERTDGGNGFAREFAEMSSRRNLTTDADGKAAAKFEAGNLRIWVWKEGFKRSEEHIAAVFDNNETKLEIKLTRVALRNVTLKGRVLDAGNSMPIPGIILNFNCGEQNFHAETTSDSGGNYSVQVPDGVIGVGFNYWRNKEYREFGIEVVTNMPQGGTLTRDIYLEPAARPDVTLSGRILDAETGMPVPAGSNFEIHVSCHEEDFWDNAEFATGTPYSMAVVRGKIRIYVSCAGYLDWNGEVDLINFAGTRHTFDISLAKPLPRDATLTLVVLDKATGAVYNGVFHVQVLVVGTNQNFGQQIAERASRTISVPRAKLRVSIWADELNGNTEVEVTGNTATVEVLIVPHEPAIPEVPR